ncbi:hypothetical protein [Lactococcus termiticola]|uniref:Membrane protein n=1 Tax=Lactococcus termiticola TaxID=2169526 RepID=A0A2R5HH49_9LACT|nr:hypothetical protein [Lactococcus termiticola]GBG97334.1 membrane protein [Lactococcus termiticola]
MKKTSKGLVLGLVAGASLVASFALAQSSKADTVYRNFNSRTGEHLYSSYNEWKTLPGLSADWHQDNVTFDEPSTGPDVYRLYNPKSGEHIFTTGLNEKRVLSSQGWTYEGVAFHSGGKVPVYRMFNAKAGIGAHLNTANANEKSVLMGQGWTYEGIAWYATDAGTANVPSAPSAPAQGSATIKNTAAEYAITAQVSLNGTGQGFHSKIEFVTAQAGVTFGIQYDAAGAAPYTGKPAFLLENIVSSATETGNQYTHTGLAKVGTSYTLLLTLQSNGAYAAYVNGTKVTSGINSKMANTTVYARVQTVGKQNGDHADSSFANIGVRHTANATSFGAITSAVFPDGFSTNAVVGKSAPNPLRISGTVSGLNGNWSTATPKGNTVQFQ